MLGRTYAETQKIDGVLLLLVCITTDTNGHGLHAVAVDKPYKTPNEMRGLNSWGATQTFMDVTPDNFRYAVALDPIIIEKKRGSQEQGIPKVTRGFFEMGSPVVSCSDLFFGWGRGGKKKKRRRGRVIIIYIFS